MCRAAEQSGFVGRRESNLSGALAIFLMVAIPLAWGLAVERVFEFLRRRRIKPTDPAEPGDPTA